MKAKLVENIDFERGQEPSKAMNIGMTPERILNKFVADLKKLGFKDTEWKPTFGMGEGSYDVLLHEREYDLLNPFEKNPLYGLQIVYITDEKSEFEYGGTEEGGFGLANIDSDFLLDDSTHYPNIVIKKILELKYGKTNFPKKIQELQDEIEMLKNIQNQLK